MPVRNSNHFKLLQFIIITIHNYCTTYKCGSRHKNWCMARVLSFLIRYFSNYYTLHRSDLAARAAIPQYLKRSISWIRIELQFRRGCTFYIFHFIAIWLWRHKSLRHKNLKKAIKMKKYKSYNISLTVVRRVWPSYIFLMTLF